tara:strand:- start:662 stop:1288 length:627 start_codon:yes stop_codon:yes gene_type:complete
VNLKSASIIKNKILSGKIEPLGDVMNNLDFDDYFEVPKKELQYDKTADISKVEKNTSADRLNELINRNINLVYAGSIVENNNHHAAFIIQTNEDLELFSLLKMDIKSKIIKNKGCFLKSNGVHWYPKNSYMGWHTNSDQPGDFLYLVWAEEDNKSFFRYKDTDTGEIITKWEKRGWQVNRFETPMWHCVASYTNRISIGYRILKPKSS